jgi:prepilin-type N-terminal cleavage/methylation domain-containing protein
MFETLRKRLHREEKGFTLIELLVVIIILGILVAIAVPSYLSFAGRAHKSANASNVRAILPSIEAYYSDNSSYAGMTLALLQSTYDQAIDPVSGAGHRYLLKSVAAGTYCIQSPGDLNTTTSYHKSNTDPEPVTGDCP